MTFRISNIVIMKKHIMIYENVHDSKFLHGIYIFSLLSCAVLHKMISVII